MGTKYFPREIKNRGRQTVLNDIVKRLNEKSFEETFKPKVVEWLPDKRPTTIYVKNAVDAVFHYFQIWN